MKKRAGLLACCLLLGGLGVAAQPTTAGRDIAVKVVDRKGRPVSNVIVRALTSDRVGVTNRRGVHTLPALRTGDSVSVVLPRIGEVYFPVEEGVDVILLTLRFDRERKKIDDPSLNTLIDFGYGGTTLKNSTGATGVIANVPEMIRQTGATTLAQLIDGQLPGVSLSGGGAIRGGRGGAPLIFLDGIPSSLEQVENGFFYQLATIVVDKNGAAYGHQGANGAIHFYTQKHFTTQE